MRTTPILGWEIVPGYDLENVDWWLIWAVVAAAVVIAAGVFCLLFFAGWRRMSPEERQNFKQTRKEQKALRTKEEKAEFKAKQSSGARLMLGWKKVGRFVFIPIFAFLFVVSSIATPVLYTYGPALYATLFYVDKPVVNETTKLAAEDAEKNVVTIEREGIVLMKNEANELPLATKKVNIFGTNAFGIFYGNGGSGEFVTDHTFASGKTIRCVKFEEAMAEEGFEYNPYLLNLCKNYAQRSAYSIAESDYNLHASIATFGTTGRYEGIKPRWIPYEHEPAADAYSQNYAEIDGKTLLEYSKAYSDTAIYCIARYGTENYDMPYSNRMDELHLTDAEKGVLGLLQKEFKHVVVLLNTPGPIAIDEIEDLGVKNIVFVGHPGLTGTRAIAEVLSGKTNPSGRLVDTWPYDLTSNPTYETFGNKSSRFTGGKTYTFSNYHEGIYVGYRYYTTRALVDDAYDYDQEVAYSFGHGLSYTDFNVSLLSSEIDLEKGTGLLTVGVTNTGKVAGKYVVEVYDEPPFTGKIEKSSRNLIAYQKTNLLEPEKTENYEIPFKIRDLASWDSAQHCYNLEKGEYVITLRENAWDAAVDTLHEKANEVRFTVESDILYKKSYQTGADYSALFEDVEYGGNDEPITYLSRKDFAGTYTKNADVNRVWATNYQFEDNNNIARKVFPDNQITEEVLTDQILDEELTLRDMKNADWNDPRWNDFLSQLSQKDMTRLVADGNFEIPAIGSIGKPRTSEGDGPASCYNQGTGHPSGTVLASTWNNDAAELFGESCGKEGCASGMTGWYAPGMNIHRSPYAGRNFEYYSEDPLIAGNMGGHTSIGSMRMGVYTFAKHYGLNEQETNRGSLNVFASEQSIREIYLKPFEIYSDLGGTGLMSAFSYMGTTWSGASEALCWKLLRDEWGFKGTVITDYNNANMPVGAGLRAGNDEWLIPQLTGNSGANAAVSQTPNDINWYLRRACKNICYSLAHSNAAWDDADFAAIGVENPRK